MIFSKTRPELRYDNNIIPEARRFASNTKFVIQSSHTQTAGRNIILKNNLICGKKERVAKLKINFTVARLHQQQSGRL
jgi:hypothetical protein